MIFRLYLIGFIVGIAKFGSKVGGHQNEISYTIYNDSNLKFMQHPTTERERLIKLASVDAQTIFLSSINPGAYLNAIAERTASVQKDSEIAEEFHKEMTRFLPNQAVKETVNSEKFWEYLSNLMQGYHQQVIEGLKKRTRADIRIQIVEPVNIISLELFLLD